MGRYIVSEVREYTERTLIEAESPEAARMHEGTVIDHDDGSGSDTGQSITVEGVEDNRDEL